MDPWQLAENLELAAQGWLRDADLYSGRRRQWRLDRGMRLFRLAARAMVRAVPLAADHEFSLVP